MLKLMYNNTRSINNKINEIKQIIYKNNYDIVCFQEVWDLKNIQFKNYKVHKK